MKLINGSIINVQAYKHDGTLYRQWNGVKVLENSPEMITLFMYKTKVAEKWGQKWVVREPILWWFPKQEFYNTTGLIRPSGTYFYTNLASTPIFEDSTLKFIDYDLDIKAYPDSPIKVVDRKEYERNSKKFKYPKKLNNILKKTIYSTIKKIKIGEDFFDKDVVDRYLEDLVEAKLISKKIAKARLL
ncbi:MAG: DUF402 domain-containing protein [Mycoplasmatales bacterium]|nr:DUF402 domain-containing protein [Mycoplasmatales bacterium]